MSTENDDHDGGEWDDPSDLTRLEDLSEFLHEEDPEVEAKLAAAQDSQDSLPDLPDEGEDLLGLDDLEDSDDFDEPTDSEPTQFDDQNEATSFSEEQTNPAFDTTDLESGDDFQSDDDDSFEASGEDSEENLEEATTEEDWNDADSSFSSDDDNDGDAFDTSEADSSYDETSEDTEDEQSWGEDSFEEQSFDNNDDYQDNDYQDDDDQNDQDHQEGSDLDLDSSGDSELSMEPQSFDDNQNDFQEKNDQDQFQSEDLDSDDSQIESNNFELPEPSEVNNNPPIQAATALDNNMNQSAPRENFQDLRDFGNAITYGVVTTGGNPPFSLILRNIKFEEDAEDIKILLREHGLVTDENEETITQGLEQGSLLISQISEYSAIFLAHKMRRFDVELRLGLSDQLHPSKSYSREGRGLVSKYNLRQNHRESLMDLNTDIDVEDIKMSTTPTLDGYNIHRYIDVITSHTLIEEEELKRLHNINLSDSEEEEQDVVLGELLEQFPKDENADSDALQFDLGLNEIYKELVVELRNEAFKIEANGVVGINFNITPLMLRSGNTTNIHYKITCSGNAVWIVDQQS